MKTFNAYTDEIDDNEAAIQAILTQLHYPEAFLSHSLAIVQFNSEFIENGMYEQLRKALPIDMIGCSTTYTGVNGFCSEFAFTVFVITGDDIEFKISSTEEIISYDNEQVINDKIVCAAKDIDVRASLILTFCGIFGRFGGDDLVDVIDAVTGGQIPLFGTIAWNSSNQLDCSYVVCNDKISTNIIVFASIVGNCSPRFIRTSSIEETVLSQRKSFGGTVTEAEGTLLKSVDDIPIIDYLKERGTSNHTDLWVLPAIMKMKNGEYVGRAFIGNFGDADSDHKGIIATGRLEQGADIAFTYLDKNAILDSARKAFIKFSEMNVRNTINFSCVARSWALGIQSDAEFIAIDAVTCKASPYILSYSGGELCPLRLEDGSIKNLFHNYSLISCILD